MVLRFPQNPRNPCNPRKSAIQTDNYQNIYTPVRICFSYVSSIFVAQTFSLCYKTPPILKNTRDAFRTPLFMELTFFL